MENKNPLEWRTETRKKKEDGWDFIELKIRRVLKDPSIWPMEEKLRQAIKDATSMHGIVLDRPKVDTSQIKDQTGEAVIRIEEAEENLSNMKAWIKAAWSLNLTWQMSRTEIGLFIFEYFRQRKTHAEIKREHRWEEEGKEDDKTTQEWKKMYLSYAAILAADFSDDENSFEKELSEWKEIPALELPQDVKEYTKKKIQEVFPATITAHEEKKKKIDYIGHISAPPTDRTKVQTPPAAPVEKEAIKIADEKAKQEARQNIKERWRKTVIRVNRIFKVGEGNKTKPEGKVAVMMFGEGKNQAQIIKELGWNRQKERYYEDRYIAHVAIFAANAGLLREQLKAFWEKSKQDGEWFGSESDCYIFTDD